MTTRQQRKRRAEVRATMGVLLIVATAVAIASLFIKSRPPALDIELCPRDIPVSGSWAIVLDATDEYNAIQRAWISNALAEIRDAIPVHGRLSLYVVRDSIDIRAAREVSLCNPGSGEGASHLTANPELLRRRWTREFTSPIDSVLNSILDGPPKPYSPIMETIQVVSIDSNRDADVPRNLIVVSDLLQHSSVESHYQGDLDTFDDFNSSNGYQRVRTDLSGWSVEILYVRRHDRAGQAVQGIKHVEFWDAYFRAMNATVARVRSVEG